MKILKMFLTAVLFLFTLPPAADHAGGFDNSRWINGALDRLVEVNRQRIIEDIDPYLHRGPAQSLRHRPETTDHARHAGQPGPAVGSV
jgi:hypothetical protein